MTPFAVARKDLNQGEFEEYLALSGRAWRSIHRAGFGVPDLLVKARYGVLVLYEVKRPKKKLTLQEEKFFSEFEGCPVEKVETVEEMHNSLMYWDTVRLEAK